MKIIRRLRNLLRACRGHSAYFGLCPACWGTATCYHVGRDEWFACNACKTRWYVGSNLFSGWRYMTEEDFEANREHLRGYRQVKPLYLGQRKEDYLRWVSAIVRV